jgi:nitrogen fixation protein NifB
LKKQLAGIKYLTARGVLVKINIVMIKGINDHHIPEIVKTVKELGVFTTNIMPLIPAPDSGFEHFSQTSMKEINELRNICQIDIQQMRHCQQCRADAIGLLGEDRSEEFRMCNLPVKEKEILKIADKKYKIAVASKYGRLVDQHFGHASEFTIYQSNGRSFEIVEKRAVTKYCKGMEECDANESRRENTILSVQDCDAVLTMRIGHHAKQELEAKKIFSVEYCDTVENGLYYTVGQLTKKVLL